ncbi:aldo/keto reductase family protein [Ktedonobacter robiniae]|uniref:Voltage-gated potassium channel n=1 Tax=Ktedonobacter robiniae TaxID=2778365 RepID=A0ABQ3V406_9CHLR|nr:aldo/keto reductase family protein [Ktedonobacter robiniae]GHO59619.1 voltage-gated potassium channel [Ktedonobacter robiniae]
MQYRRLGNTGTKVSSVALGGWINYGEGKTAQEAAQQVIRTAYEKGINYFDIADVYGRGEAEKEMGAVLRDFPRHTLVIASKVFWPMSNDVNDRGLSRKHIMESVEKSLKRIGTDYIDIYFCHRPDPETPLLETARAMDDLIHQGKVLYWGTSMWEGSQIAEVYQLCERYNLYAPVVEQPQYSMLERERVEREILPIIEPRGIGLVAFSPLGQGMLTGKYDNGIDEGTRFHRETWVRDRFFNDANVSRVRKLKEIADELGASRAQLALAWVLRNSGVSSAIIGATRPEQVEDNVQAIDFVEKLGDEVLQRIDAILA